MNDSLALRTLAENALDDLKAVNPVAPVIDT
jgi:hypothetical protein